MLNAFTGTQVRAAEEPLLRAGLDEALMQRAAHGLAGAVVRLLADRGIRAYGARVVVLAGSGNNGGDALFAAAALARRGTRTTALLTGARTHPAALAAFLGAGGRTVELAAEGPPVVPAAETGGVAGPARVPSGPAAQGGFLAEAAVADVIIDGILGTGAQSGLREPAAAVVRQLKSLHGPAVVACDLPSGVNADTGEVSGPVLRADLTVTFGAAKAGLLAPPGEGYAGHITVIDIGLANHLPAAGLRRLESCDLAALLPAPERSSQKYSRGVLGVVAGSSQYPGAAQLSCAGALACGVGMVRYLGPAPVAALIHGQSPEVVCSEGSVAESRVQAWLVGPGLGGEDQLQRARDAFASGLPVVADAGALPVLPASVDPRVILTPHAGELASLLSTRGCAVSREAIEADALAYARRAATMTGATVLLKGATTVVASPSGTVFSQSEGTPWLATAGSGDTLAGILGALAAALADDVERFRALGIADEDRWAALAAAGASLHGRAGALASGGGPLRAQDIGAAVPTVWRQLLAPNGAHR
jgi:hydroxyethylthiazole kinase-like uncharacterized protein yjeF